VGHALSVAPLSEASRLASDPRSRGFNQGANFVQTNPNKTKQNSLDFLGFPWFYSSESGLFNGLRAKK
jgi:hypothetical protein